MTIGQYLENKLGEEGFKALLESMYARTREVKHGKNHPKVRRSRGNS